MKNFLAAFLRDRMEAKTDERLSAYLDGALNPRERARLEAELARDPHLRARLEALRQTVALVRALPSVRAPRNFLLTPAMVAEPRPTSTHIPARRLHPLALTFATALSALICVLLLVGNLLSAGWGLPRAAAPAPMVAYEERSPAALGVAPTGEVTGTVSAEALLFGEALPSDTPEISGTPTPATGAWEWEEMPDPLEIAPPGGVSRSRTPVSTPEPYLGIGGGGLILSEEPTPEMALRAAATQAATAEPTPEPLLVSTPAQRSGEQAMWPFLSWLPVGGMALLTLILAVLTVRAWRAQ